MTIDKVKPYITDTDRKELARLDEQIELVVNKAHELNVETDLAREAGDEQRATELHASFNKLWLGEYNKLYTDKNALLLAIEQRYIDSFKGDIAALLDDVREIVAAVTKEDYLRHQQGVTADINFILDNYPKGNLTKQDREHLKRMKPLAVRGYVNCRLFILGHIRVQLNAFAHYNSQEGRDEAIAIVEARAEQFYKKPKGAQPAQPPEREYPLPIKDRTQITGSLLTLPSSPVLTLINEALGAGNLDALPENKKRYNRNQQYIVEGQGDKRRISYTKDRTQVSIEFADFRKLDTRNPQTKKLLTRILVRAAEQAIHNGELARDKVSFSLRELVGEGQYSNIETARQGFYNSADILTGLKVSGKLERGKKKTIQQGVHAVLFKAAKVDNATCEVYLNELLNWGLIAPYYTGLPDYYFELPGRAAELLEYIFMLARQNTRNIADKGYFTISYRAIQTRLNLPDEGKTKNPGRDIKDAIETAIEQIEEKYREKSKEYAPPLKEGEDPDFSLLPQADYYAPIKEYLDNGYLEVHLKGDYAKRFIEISRKTAEKIEAANKRRERIEDGARAINLAKDMERDKK